MKLEHLSDANVGGSGDDLIRLFDFTPSQVRLLADVIGSVLLSEGKSIQLDAVEFIKPMNCQLTLTLSDKDLGIHRSATSIFTCELTSQGYLGMIELMGPYMMDGATGHQWLYDLPNADNRTEFLISRNGKW